MKKTEYDQVYGRQFPKDTLPYTEYEKIKHHLASLIFQKNNETTPFSTYDEGISHIRDIGKLLRALLVSAGSTYESNPTVYTLAVPLILPPDPKYLVRVIDKKYLAQTTITLNAFPQLDSIACGLSYFDTAVQQQIHSASLNIPLIADEAAYATIGIPGDDRLIQPADLPLDWKSYVALIRTVCHSTLAFLNTRDGLPVPSL